MFKLGEMFVAFVGKDGGLARTVKLAESMGKNVTKIFQTAVKEGGRIGVAVARGFERIGISASRAGTQVARSMERMATAGARAASRIGPAMLRSFDRLTASAGKVASAGLKSFGQIGSAAVKQIGPLAKLAGQAGSGFASMAGMVGGASSGMTRKFFIAQMAATAMWSAITGGMSAIISLVTGIGRLGASMVTMAGNTQEFDSKFDVVFGSSAPEARKQFDLMSRSMGRSSADLRKMGSDVQDILVPLGFARDKAAGMSVTIAQLAVDMASFNNVSDSAAIEDVHAALAGSHEVMKKYGVALNENTMKAELAKMGYHGTTEAASEQMKTLARLNIIIRGTGDAQGDAVRTGGSFANQMKRIMGLVMDIGRSIGRVFLPAAEVFARFFSDQLQVLKDNSGAIEAWGSTLAGWAEVAVQWLQRLIMLFTNWGEISKSAYNIVAAAVDQLLTNLVIILDNVEILIGDMFNKLLQFFPALMTSIAQTHGSLWGFLRRGWKEIWDFIKSGGTDAIDLDIGAMLKNFKDQFEGPKFKGLESDKFMHEWNRLIAEIDARINKTKKTADGLPPIKEFDPSLLGVDPGGKKKIDLELVGASELFKKTLEAAFEDKDKEQALEFQKKGVEVAVEALTVAKDQRDTAKKQLDESRKPVVKA